MLQRRNKKLLFVTGTRAEYGLAKATILRLKKCHEIDFRLLVTGMHTLHKFGLTLNDIKKDIKVDHIVSIKESDDMLTALTREISGIQKYVQREKIDAIMVAGDRDETFAAATVGIHLNIPIIHVSGGDVSGPSVDHYLRNAMTIFSKLHLVQTAKSAQNVIRLGANPKNVHVIGSMGLHNLNPKKLMSRDLISKELKLNSHYPWYLTTHHPTPFENVSFKNQIDPLLNAGLKLGTKSEKVIIYPNSDEGSSIFISKIEKFRNKAGYHIFKNLNHELFLSTLYNSKAVIGNSTSGLFEAGFLKIPFVNVGNRQLGREQGANVINAPYNSPMILNAISKASSSQFQKKLKCTPPLYSGGDVAGKIIKLTKQFIHEKKI